MKDERDEGDPYPHRLLTESQWFRVIGCMSYFTERNLVSEPVNRNLFKRHKGFHLYKSGRRVKLVRWLTVKWIN